MIFVKWRRLFYCENFNSNTLNKSLVFNVIFMESYTHTAFLISLKSILEKKSWQKGLTKIENLNKHLFTINQLSPFGNYHFLVLLEKFIFIILIKLLPLLFSKNLASCINLINILNSFAQPVPLLENLVFNDF